MDLNLLIYQNGFDTEKVIYNKLEYAYNVGYKKVALSVKIDDGQIQKIPIPIKIDSLSSEIKVYSRLTIKISEIMQLYQLSKQDNFKHYDLLAIEPLNEKILNYLNSGNFDCDIITFNYEDNKMINAIKKANFTLPIMKGIGIELNYSSCLSGSALRRQALASGQMLVDKTNSKNIMISSGTNSISLIRSAKDVIYMGLLFGLKEHESKKSVYQNGNNVLKHSELRRNIVSSIMEISMLDQNIHDELKNGNKRILVEEDKIIHISNKKNKI